MNSTALATKGYRLNEAEGIWTRADYAGIPYSDGDDVENAIEKIVESCGDVALFSSDLQPHMTDWATVYHLSPSRANILRPFEERLPNAEVLEIGAGCGAITRYLGEAGANVLALEGSLRRARICRKRTQGLSNVTVLAERFADFSIDNQFDVITLIGVLEYANRFTPTEHPARDMLRQVGKLLKPDGILIIAIENQLGLKYFAGALEDHIGQPMYGVENRYRSDQACTFGKKKLTGILSDAGFTEQTFLAPFPDYKLPTVIVSEQGLDTAGFNVADLICQTEAQDLQSPRLPTFSQFSTWPSIIENGLGMDLANSFLIAASQVKEVVSDDLLAYHFSTQRPKEHCKSTVFQRTSDHRITVTGRPMFAPTSSPSDKKLPDENPAYIDHAHPLTKDLFAILTDNQGTLAQVESFYVGYRDLIGKMAGVNIQPRSMLPLNFIDAIPQNILITQDGAPHLIDKEWEAPCPLEFDFLLFRAIIYSHNACRLIRMDAQSGEVSWRTIVTAIFTRLGLECSDERFALFASQEAVFQKQLNPLGGFDFWDQNKDKPIRKPDLFNSHQTLREAMDTAGQLNDHLVKNIKQLESTLDEILRSTSWRITAPIRNLLSRK
jgi:SAM-dependent methyltransferase